MKVCCCRYAPYVVFIASPCLQTIQVNSNKQKWFLKATHSIKRFHWDHLHLTCHVPAIKYTLPHVWRGFSPVQCVLDTFPAAIQLHYLSIGQCPTLVVLTFVSSGFFVKISNKRSLIRCAPPEVEHPTLFLLCTWWTMCGAPLHIHSKHMMHLLPLIHTDSL